IDSASTAPQIAEFELYNASGSPAPGSSASSASSVTPPVSQTVRYEAESAYLYRGIVDNIHSGYSGSGFADYENVNESYAEWTVTVPSAGQATATFRFANGTTTNRPMAISVNGAMVNSSLDFNGTGGWASWATQSMTLTLTAGTNVIRAASTTANGGPNVDYLEITTSGSAPSSSASSVAVSSVGSSTPQQPSSSSAPSSSVSSAPNNPSSSSSSTPGGEWVLGTNLAGNAGADGSSKGGGTSYGNVTDGNLGTYWPPSSTSGQRISIKGLSGSFNTVIIRELNNATTSWRLVNNDNGTVLASGTSLGSERVITGFGTISASK